MHCLNFHHYLWICSLLSDYVMFCFKSLLYMCFRRFVLNYAIANCVVWHGCKSNCRPLSLPVASFKPDYKNLVTGPCSRQCSWQHYFHLVTACKKVCLTWGAWKWSLMRALTDCVQSFWGNVWQHWGSLKGFTSPLSHLHLCLPPTAWWTPVCL